MKKLWLGNFPKSALYVGGNIFWSISNKGSIGNFSIPLHDWLKEKNHEFAKPNSLNISSSVIDPLVDSLENMFSALAPMATNIFHPKYELLSQSNFDNCFGNGHYVIK